jgi:hypothetical protein
MADVRIKFEDPPARRGGGAWSPKGTHEIIAAKLRERPGEWARIQALPSVQSAAGQAHAPAGSFESKSRTVDGESRVYARYVGEGFSE